MTEEQPPSDEPSYITNAKYKAALIAIKRLDLDQLKELRADLEGLIENRQDKLTELLMENNQIEEPETDIPRIEAREEEE